MRGLQDARERLSSCAAGVGEHQPARRVQQQHCTCRQLTCLLGKAAVVELDLLLNRLIMSG